MANIPKDVEVSSLCRRLPIKVDSKILKDISRYEPEYHEFPPPDTYIIHFDIWLHPLSKPGLVWRQKHYANQIFP
jgi:hypothetical protein